MSFRSRWVAEVFRTSRVPDSVKLTLVALAAQMRDNGYVSYPRSRLAEDLGRSPRRITERLQAAREAGLLARVSAGFKGHTAEYRACLPDRKGRRILAPFGGADGRTLGPPVMGADGGPTIDRVVVAERQQPSVVDGWGKAALDKKRPRPVPR